MMDIVNSFKALMPHGQCFLWQPDLLWLHVGSDAVIAFSYYLISGTLFYFLYKRKDLPFQGIFVLFGLFILACGTTHLMAIWTVWSPDYWEEGMVKLATAGLSLSTGLILIPILPKALKLESPMKLEKMNADLTRVLDERDQAYTILQTAREELYQRTEELEANQIRLRALATELNLTEQRERRQIALELHDYLAQHLVVCRFQVSQCLQAVELNTKLNTSLSKADELLEESLAYTRSLVAQLSPHVLHQFGLIKALQALAEHMSTQGLTVNVETEREYVALPENHAVLLYQSVRELLFNVLKHAGVNQAAVVIKVVPEMMLHITVSDRGKGFSPMREKLKEASAGRFGLFSINERMIAIGGEVAMESEMDLGTRITLTLPCQIDDSPYGDKPAHEQARGFETTEPPSFVLSPPSDLIQVLLVDDHAMVRQGLRSILEQYDNIQIVGEASNGRDAVDMQQRLAPNVVVMDVNMPVMDGIQATRLIRQSHPFSHVIGLSVRNDRETEQALRDAGASEFVTKESASDQLYQAICRVVQGKKPKIRWTR
jgi:signal transduction histidine kinase/ActR/RegA family two-component response regulator